MQAQWQWGQWVLGGETTWTATGIRKTITSPYFPDSDTETAKISSYATVVGRVGYAFDRADLRESGLCRRQGGFPRPRQRCPCDL